MAKLPRLNRFGVNFDDELIGKVIGECYDGPSLIFLFGEHHFDNRMIRDNILDACALFDRKVIKQVFVEESLESLHWDSDQQISNYSSEFLRQTELTSAIEVIRVYRTNRGKPTGKLGFGFAVKYLKPDIEVIEIEDQQLKCQVAHIRNRYLDQMDGICLPGGWPLRFEDHQIHSMREQKFIDNLLSRWDQSKPAILNTGCSHTLPLATRLKRLGISFIQVEQFHMPEDRS